MNIYFKNQDGSTIYKTKQEKLILVKNDGHIFRLNREYRFNSIYNDQNGNIHITDLNQNKKMITTDNKIVDDSKFEPIVGQMMMFRTAY